MYMFIKIGDSSRQLSTFVQIFIPTQINFSDGALRNTVKVGAHISVCDLLMDTEN
jgi:hypothetical protein